MATIIRYQPQGIMMPTELVQKHVDLLKYSVLSDNFNTADADACYPLIHDMFRSRDDKHIIAMDSAYMHLDYVPIFAGHTSRVTKQLIDWSGLKKDLLPLKIYHNKKPVHYRYRISPHESEESQKLKVRMTLSVGFYEIDLTTEMQSKDKIELEWVWNNWSQTRVIERNPFRTLKPTPFILHTTQRDNPPIWIHDWCAYYRREHGVQRIVLYDNGSKDVQAYIDKLQSINDAMEIVVIAWPYDFTKIFANAQRVALNHCPAIFTDLARYYLNFDIDEYLLNPSKYSLKEYLIRTDRVKRHCYRIKGYIVPRSKADTTVAVGAVASLAHSQRVAKYHDRRAPKTINIYKRFEFIDIHYTYGQQFYTPPPLPQAWLLRTLLKPIWKAISKIHLQYYKLQQLSITETMAIMQCKTINIVTKLLLLPVAPNYRKHVLTFNHNRNLGNDWYGPKRSESTHTDNQYHRDTLIPEKLQKHGLVSQSTQNKK